MPAVDEAAEMPVPTSVPAKDQRNEPFNAPSKSFLAGQECIQLKVQFGRDSATVQRPLDSTVKELKLDIEERTGIPPNNQKLLYKGQLKEESTLRQAGLKTGCKVMVVGSGPKASVLPKAKANQEDEKLVWDAPKTEETWSDSAQHMKALAKGRPDDGWVGIKDKQVPLQEEQTYIPGLLNSQGTKVRLTFKPELGQLWIGSATSTQKVPYGSISKIDAQPIKEQEEYSIVRMQLGSSGASQLWLYYVPSQSVSGIKLRILGLGALL